MASDAHRGIRERWLRLEHFSLGLGLLSGLSLFVAGTSLHGVKRFAGEAALQKAAGVLHDVVLEEWQRLQGPSSPCFAQLEELYRWNADALFEATTFLAEAPEPPLSSALTAFLADSRQLQLQGSLERASHLLEQAQSVCHSPREFGEVYLRQLQLSRRAADPEFLWQISCAAQARLQGSEAQAGISLRLLCGLAVLPKLEPSQQATLADSLADLWARGELTLPSGQTHLERSPAGRLRLTDNVALLSLARRLRPYLSQTADEKLNGSLEGERARRLQLSLGGLPTELAPATWGYLELTGEDLLVYRHDPRTASEAQAFEGGFLTLADLRDNLHAALSAQPLFAQDFVLAFDEEPAQGLAIRARTALLGTRLGFEVQHKQPQDFVRRESGSLGALRWVLFGLAGFALFAGLTSFLAQRRERLLVAAKTRFVAAISHELRTPVTAISLAVENLRAGRAKDVQRQARYHDLIETETRRLQRLVEDVLDVSRAEHGHRVVLKRESLALSAVAATLEQVARQECAASSLKFEYSATGLCGSAQLDLEALRRATLNLVRNACLHSGGTRILLELELKGNRLYLRVSDDGVGVPVAQHERLFRPFEQGASSAGSGLQHTRGAGLGLAIVRELAQAHGGSARLCAGLTGRGLGCELSLPLN